MADWMIYGATGYTGVLVAEEAVRRGHKPLLAGRSASKLKALAERLGLEFVAVDLSDREGLAKAVARVKLVYHAAGPFTYTSEPMLQACLTAGAHYLDITGELKVYQQVYRQHEAALAKGIALVSGAAFDVTPSDCLIQYVAEQLPDATHLVVALDMLGTSASVSGNTSAGTAKSQLEILAGTGNLERKDGKLVAVPLGSGARTFQFADGERKAMPVPLSDLEAGYRTTGIPNITACLCFPPTIIQLLRVSGGLVQGLLKVDGVRRFAGSMIDRTINGPSEGHREQGRSSIYAQVRNAKGEIHEAWMETAEGYQFTMLSAPLVVEHILNRHLKGALSPAQAFGVDFPLQIEGTKRWDRLP